MDENDSLISAPPPPPEVKVRTMQSDLAAMARSGGGLPRFENVRVIGWSPESGKESPAQSGGGGGRAAAAPRDPKRLRLVLIIAIAVVGAVIAGYFIYAAISGSAARNQNIPSQQSNTGTSGSSAGTSSLPAAAPILNLSSSQQSASESTVPAGPFTHSSFFSKPADQTLQLVLSSGGPAQTAGELLTFDQKLASVLAKVKQNSSLVEIDVADGAGGGIPVGDIWTQANTGVLGSQFLSGNFNPDATFFAYHDASGFWPGWVLELQPGKSRFDLQSGVAQLESSPNIANFFVKDPGAPAAGGFVNDTVSGVPVRALDYPSAKPAESFIYGWVASSSRELLVLSTSRGGFIAALSHL